MSILDKHMRDLRWNPPGEGLKNDGVFNGGRVAKVITGLQHEAVNVAVLGIGRQLLALGLAPLERISAKPNQSSELSACVKIRQGGGLLLRVIGWPFAHQGGDHHDPQRDHGGDEESIVKPTDLSRDGVLTVPGSR